MRFFNVAHLGPRTPLGCARCGTPTLWPNREGQCMTCELELYALSKLNAPSTTPMETRYSDGRSDMQAFDDVEQLKRAMAEKLAQDEVVSVTAHKVGSTITKHGRTYVLNALGQWERVGKRRRDKGYPK